MERLNLSNGKVRVFKLKTFLILLLFCLLPSLALIFLSYQIRILRVGELLGKYPVIFNNLSDFNIGSIENQIKNLQSSFQKKFTEISKANLEIKKQLLDIYKSNYFLNYFSELCSSIPNKVFLKEMVYDGTRLRIEFYEYGLETKVSTSTIYERLSKVYQNVSVQLVEEKTFFSNTKYFHYVVEGMK